MPFLLNITEPKRKNGIRCRPERRRSGFGITVLSVVRFVPFVKGTAVAGATAGVSLFFQVQPGFFKKKKWGCNIKKRADDIRPYFIFGIQNPILTKKFGQKTEILP